MFAREKTEHLDVGNLDGSASRRDIAHRTMQDALMRSCESTLLDGDVAADVEVVHVGVCVRKGLEPAAVEPDTGRLSFPAHPARRVKGHIVGEHAREPVKIVSIEGVRPSLESLAYGDRHEEPPSLSMKTVRGSRTAADLR